MKDVDDEYGEVAGGEIRFWVEQNSSIQLKAITEHGDPVELTADEATELVNKLLSMIKLID